MVSVIDNMLHSRAALSHHLIFLQEPPVSTEEPPSYFEFSPSTAGSPRAITWIRTSIPLTNIHHLVLDLSRDLVVTDVIVNSLRTRFINVYNDRHTHEAFLRLQQDWPELPPAPGGIHLSGDFNLHHPLWPFPTQPLSAADIQSATPLVDVCESHSLQLSQDPGLPTFTGMGRRSTNTTIDIVFTAGRLREAFYSTKLFTELGSDHNGLSTTYLEDQPTSAQISPARFRFDDADWERFNAALTLALQSCPFTSPSASSRDLDATLKALDDAIWDAIRATVPMRRPSPHSKP